MFDTSECGASQDEMYGRLVPGCIAASEGFYHGAGLTFKTRPGFDVVGSPPWGEVKSYIIGSREAGPMAVVDCFDKCSFIESCLDAPSTTKGGGLS